MTSSFVIPRFYYLDVLSEYHPILKIIFIGCSPLFVSCNFRLGLLVVQKDWLRILGGSVQIYGDVTPSSSDRTPIMMAI
jgi:hypothetical protein